MEEASLFLSPLASHVSHPSYPVSCSVPAPSHLWQASFHQRLCDPTKLPWHRQNQVRWEIDAFTIHTSLTVVPVIVLVTRSCSLLTISRNAFLYKMSRTCSWDITRIKILNGYKYFNNFFILYLTSKNQNMEVK